MTLSTAQLQSEKRTFHCKLSAFPGFDKPFLSSIFLAFGKFRKVWWFFVFVLFFFLIGIKPYVKSQKSPVNWHTSSSANSDCLNIPSQAVPSPFTNLCLFYHIEWLKYSSLLLSMIILLSSQHLSMVLYLFVTLCGFVLAAFSERQAFSKVIKAS